MSKVDKIIFIGGGGHSLSCAEIVSRNDNYELAGYLDPQKNSLLSQHGIERLGSDNILEATIKKYKNFLITIGHVKSPKKRIELFNKIINLGGSLPNLISKFSYVSKFSKIGKVTIIMNGVVINSNSTIMDNCIINTSATIEHEVKINSHVHIAPSATILGNVNIGAGSFIGAGAIIKEGVKINANTFIKAGEKVFIDR